MDLHADPVALRRGADQLATLAGDLEAMANRIDRLTADGSRSRLADRCDALVTSLRSDAAQLSACEGLLRQDRSGLLAGETSVLARLTDLDRRLSDRSGWSR